MKTFPAVVLAALVLGGFTVSAQMAPKLAIAEVTAAPTLAKKFNVPVVGDTNASGNAVDLTGVWTGDTRNNGRAWPYVLTVTKGADGLQYAELKNIKRNNDFHSTSVACRDWHVTITFNEGGQSQFLDGWLKPGYTRMEMHWNNGTGNARLNLERSQMMSSSKQTGGTVAPVVSLDVITRALENQLADRFEVEHAFTLLEGDDLRNAIPSKENQTYNLKDLETARQFRLAGINYLLLTTIEDMKNETVDRAQGRVGYETASGSAVGVRKGSRRENARAAAHADIATQGKFDAHRVIDQNVYLLIRCRLFNAATGALLDSASHTFTTNRTYVALAEGTKEVSTSDLFETAAKTLADRIVAREREVLFPITVLAKDGKELTVNGGADTGLKTGQVFNVYAVGRELTDPVSGEPLGHDEQLVGRIVITQLQPKFSKAKVWEDNGIVVGNFLRRDKTN